MEDQNKKQEPKRDTNGNPVCETCNEGVKEVVQTPEGVYMCACCLGRRGLGIVGCS